MSKALSPNTKAILLLTAPLITGGGQTSPGILTPGEYKRLARRLRELQRQPADLLAPEAGELLKQCQAEVDPARVALLLERGFQLSQAVERWQARSIWVVSRADADYPARLKLRLKEDAPPVLYGCGDARVLGTGGLAVVGSRNVDEALIQYTERIGQLAAAARQTVVSGGARGVDQAAMRGALEAGGTVAGVLADSLERAALNRENRNVLMDGRLALISPCDPGAGFNVGNAMQRNKLIYALTDAALVVNSDYEKGGTWAGAVEQLGKYAFVRVYVRSTGEPGKGIEELRKRGAVPWPNPEDPQAFVAALTAQGNPEPEPAAQDPLPFTAHELPLVKDGAQPIAADTPPASVPAPVESSPADELFAAARKTITKLLYTPRKDSEVAAELNVLPAQARAWLQRLVNEGVVEKRAGPARYVTRQTGLFEG
jgi:DNA processing protein